MKNAQRGIMAHDHVAKQNLSAVLVLIQCC